MATYAALASATGAVVGATAATVASPADSRPSPVIVAAVAAAGGLGGFLLWRLTGEGREGRAAAAAVKAAEERALRCVDQVHAKQSKKDSPLDIAYCKQVERWTVELRGGQAHVPSALRLAARSQHLRKHAQNGQLQEFLSISGIEPSLAARTAALVAALVVKDASLAHDPDMQTLEDAVSLVSLDAQQLSKFQEGRDDTKTTEQLQKTWRRMSRPARAQALALDYSPRMLCCLLQAIVSSEGLEATMSPMVAPRLPTATVKLLRESWKLVPEDKLGAEFYARLYAEEPALREVFDVAIAKPQNVPKAVRLLLDLLDTERVPRLERVVHAMASLGLNFGSLRTAHLAPIKRALVRCIRGYAPSKERNKINQVWETFFYSLSAVAAPCLIMGDRLEELTAATAASLPTPGGGTHAAAMAAHGVALLKMCLGITALSQNGTAAPEEVLGKLHEANGWLLQSVKEEVNAYCGLLSASLAVSAEPEAEIVAVQSGSAAPQGVGGAPTWTEAEQRRWQRRSVEVPLNISEISMGVAMACLPCKRQIKRSLHPDWLAGVKLLRTATEISLRNVQINLQALAAKGIGEGLEKRFRNLLDTEPQWEDLMDIS